jgi:heme A synthase
MVVAFAVGLNRALPTGRGSTWAPRLIGAFGVSLMGAGAFRADPGAGFPAGTPATTSISWHGMLHFMVGGVGFLCLIAACLLLGSRLARSGEKGWAAFSRATGVVFLAAFAGIASGSGTPAIILSFVTAIVLVWTWTACFAIKTYRTVR